MLSEKNDSYLKYRSLSTYAKNNELVGCGGAISFNATKVDDNDKDKINDSAKDGWLWILESTFENNEASYLGGAIFAETVGGTLHVDSAYGTAPDRQVNYNVISVFKNNIAGKAGGAICVDNTECRVEGATFIGNKAEQGGAIFTSTHDADDPINELELKRYGGTADNPDLDDPLPDLDDTTCYLLGCTFEDNDCRTNITETRYFLYPNDKNDNADNPLTQEKNSQGQRRYDEFASLLTSDGGVLRDENGKLKFVNHTIQKSAADSTMYAGGAIFTFVSKVVFDQGVYMKNNYNTLYTVGGKVWILRQTTDHDYLAQAGLTEKQDITFTGNKGQYVFGHGLNFEADFYFLGGQIINNELETVIKSTKTLNWYDYAGEGPKYKDSSGADIPGTQSYKAWLQSYEVPTDEEVDADKIEKVEVSYIDFADEGVTDKFKYNPYLFNYNPDGYVRSTATFYNNENYPSKWYYYINYNLDGVTVTDPNNSTEDISSNRYYPSHIGKNQVGSQRTIEDNDTPGVTGDAVYGQDTLAERIQFVMQKDLVDRYEASLTALNLSFKPEQRVIYCGGNLRIKGNTRPETNIEQNLPLEESSDNRIYRFGLLKKYRLAVTAEVSLTPQEAKKTPYQLFGEGYEGATVNNNKGLWTEDWIEGCTGDGAVPANMFINARQNDVGDGRVIYIRDGQGEHYEIMLEDPNQLLCYTFNMLADDEDGKTKLSKEFKAQYIEDGSKVKSPITKNPQSIQDLIYSSDSNMRLLDFMGFQDRNDVTTNADRFKVFDFDKNIDKATMIAESDMYNQYEIYGVYSRLDRPHKICGTAVGDACNHLDGVNHDSDIYGYYNGDVNTKKNQEMQDTKKVVEVATAAQLLYAYIHPEYLYELQNDIVLTDTIWNRPIDGILNDNDHPINNFKLCLNGHSILIDSSMSFLALAGQNCYIMNCQNKDTYIHYTPTHYPSTNTINFPENKTNVDGSLISDSQVDVNIFGYQKTTFEPEHLLAFKSVEHGIVYLKDHLQGEHRPVYNVLGEQIGEGTYIVFESTLTFNGHTYHESSNDHTWTHATNYKLGPEGMVTQGAIIFDTMYTSSTKQSFMNLGANNKLHMDNVRYQNIGSTSSNADSRILGSILTVPCESYMSRMSFTKIVHQLTRALSTDGDGNGIIRFTDDSNGTGVAKKHVLQNCYFGDNVLTKNGTGVVSSHLVVKGSSLEVKNAYFNNNIVGGSGVMLFTSTSNKGHEGSVTIDKVQFLKNNRLYDETVSEYKAGAISAKGLLGDFTIKDSQFEENGYKELGNRRNLTGGAICIEGASVNTKDSKILIKDTNFKKNIGYMGGAIYLANSANVGFENVNFSENVALSGSAVYTTETNGKFKIGNKTYKDVTFSKNGLDGTTKYGTVWTSNVTTATSNTIFENITAEENNGVVAFLYTDTLIGSNIAFIGTNSITKNNGSAIVINPSQSKAAHDTIVFFDGENYIKDNKTNQSYAIAALAHSNTRFAFNNIIDIRNNKNVDDKEANFLINNYVNHDNSKENSKFNNQPFMIAKYDDKIGSEDGTTLYGSGSILATKSYISFSVNKAELINRNIDILLFQWNESKVQDFGAEHLMSNHHILIDEPFKEQGFAVYKTRSTASDTSNGYSYGDDFLAIGQKTQARAIYGYSSKTLSTETSDEYTMIKYGATGYVDNFGDPVKDTGYDSYTYEGWLGETEKGYTVWNFKRDRMLSNREAATQALDAMWSTTHGHKVCGTKDGESCADNDNCGLSHDDGGDWIVAYSDRFLNIFDNRKYVLQDDITMTVPIKNPKPGYAICLNGHTITRPQDNNLVSMKPENGNGSFYLTNCNATTGYI